MGWLRVCLSDEQKAVVNAERESHPDSHVRRKMLAIWLLHNGVTREAAAEIVGVARSAVQRYVAAFRDGGLDGLRRWGCVGPVSDMAAHGKVIRESLESAPVRTVAQAADRIKELTGIERKPSQVRKFLKGMGMSWRMVRAVPVPPKKTSTSTSGTRPNSCGTS